MNVFQNLFEFLDVRVTSFDQGSIVTRFIITLRENSDVTEADVMDIFDHEGVTITNDVITSGVLNNRAVGKGDFQYITSGKGF